MIDGDWDGSSETIGEVETTMGALMGARKQVWMDRLVRDGSEKRNGIIIVRVEPVAESHMAAKFKLKWSNVNNVTTGCLGMCQSRKMYRFTIERQIAGTKQFATVKKSHF